MQEIQTINIDSGTIGGIDRHLSNIEDQLEALDIPRKYTLSESDLSLFD